MKCNHIHIIRVPEGEEREQKIENLFEEIMKENFSNLVKEKEIQAQETQRVPNKMNTKGLTPRNFIIKMAKVKDKKRILKAAREKQIITYNGAPIRLSAVFLTETLQDRKDWHEVFKLMKNKDLKSRLLYSAIVSFKIEGKIKSFPDLKKKKRKIKEFIITKQALQ